jgi:hypothetical protein
MLLTNRFVPSRRRNYSPVSADVSNLENRSLLSGIAIYPQPATVSPQAAAPADFSGAWTMTVQDEPIFKGLDLTQVGSSVSGTFSYDYGDGLQSNPITSGSVAKKKLTIETSNLYTFTLQVKLKGQDAFKGKFIGQAGDKHKVTGSRAAEA